MRIPALFAAALVPLSVGCLQQVDYVEPESIGFFGGDSGDYTDISSSIRDGVLSGRFGPNDRRFDNEAATSVSGFTDSYGSSNVTLITDGGGRIGMLIIDTYDASLVTLPAGTYRSSSTQASQVSVMVCSADFDAPANDADVVIADQPDGTRTITVEAVVNEQATYGMDNSDDPAIADFTLVR